MTRVGDIRNPQYASASVRLVWSTLAPLFPRGISPSDIDFGAAIGHARSVVEVGWCFALFELKTVGTKIPRGQFEMYRRMILSWPVGRSVFVEMMHRPLLQVCDPAKDVLSLRYHHRCPISGGLVGSREVHGGALPRLISTFVHDAETKGRLDVPGWSNRLRDAA